MDARFNSVDHALKEFYRLLADCQRRRVGQVTYTEEETASSAMTTDILTTAITAAAAVSTVPQ